jgi:hypothetical protein
MAATPDRTPGTSDEEATLYESTGLATVQGEQRYTGTRFSLYDAIGEFDPRATFSHRDLRHLIHFIDSGPALDFASGAFHEILPSGSPFPTSETWWESAAQIEKIVQLTITRDSQQKPTTEIWQMYDTDGTTVLETITDVISYSGPFETTRTRTIA